mmetsp:Transcript_86997/g.153840  ORF Transcript_86997/g.153840 Transcript_86997/m.153840 type:complete len:234 (-) Transcript_86997:1399-2100(-)
MRPLSIVVTCPDCRILVGANEERSGEHKGPVTWNSLLEPFKACTVHVVAVHVVNITVLNVSVAMDSVSWHGHLWSVEDRWLVHVIPDVSVGVGARVLVKCKLRAPVFSHLGVRKVRIERRPWPAPPLKVCQLGGWILNLARLPHSLVCRIVDLWCDPGSIFFRIPGLWLSCLRIRNLGRFNPISRLRIARVIHLFVGDLLHKEALFLHLLVHVELVFLLDVRINDIDKHAPLC